jgi:hypothetical protein
MGTATTTPAPAASGVGAELKAFFEKIGRTLDAVGNETLKIIGAAQKEVPLLAPGLNAAISNIFGPGVALSAAGVEKILGAALGAASAVGTALQSEGLNPSLDETAAVTVAGVIHGTGTSVAAATGPSAPAS